jgi:hypothetical protein
VKNDVLERAVLQRAQRLEGSDVVIDGGSLIQLGNAIVLQTPSVDGYGVTHITISHFPNGVPEGALDVAKG